MGLQWSRNKKGLGGQEFVFAVMHGCKAAARGKVQEWDVTSSHAKRGSPVHFCFMELTIGTFT